MRLLFCESRFSRNLVVVVLLCSAVVLSVACSDEYSTDVLATGQPKTAEPRIYDWDFFRELYLGNFLVRRVVDSDSLANVRNWVVEFLEGLGWTVELHSFRQTVPTVDSVMTGEKQFTNIIATLWPEMCEKVIFACHYESKYFNADSNFIGAMDSAVPCAMILSAADFLGYFGPEASFRPMFATPTDSQSASKDRLNDSSGANNKQGDCVEGFTPQLVFFDGEEAIKTWTTGDKLYGSTALAALWEAEGKIQDISLLVILDLLGPKTGYGCTLCTKIRSYYESTQPQYDAIRAIETALWSSGLLAEIDEFDPEQNANFSGSLFGPETAYPIAPIIDDDHRPFLTRGVENVLHLIPMPFPENHHKIGDDEDGLDRPTTLNLDLIFRCFFCSFIRGSDEECCNLGADVFEVLTRARGII